MHKVVPLHLVQWLKEAGIQEIYSPEAVNRFKSEHIPATFETLDSTVSEPVKEILQPISACTAKTLDELRVQIESFDACSLKKTAMHTVFCDGNPKADVMIIGEAPGADEDRQGKPFVGQSGQLLRLIFTHIGLTLDHIYITNVLPWRPPGNRQPTPMEIAMCLPFLQRHIELVNPKIIVLAGSTAVKALLNNSEGITKIHGTWYSYMTPALKAPIPIMPIYHPAFLLRSPSKKKDVWMDMLEIKRKLAALKS
jgi:uracil-DNA glycosylase family 4